MFMIEFSSLRFHDALQLGALRGYFTALLDELRLLHRELVFGRIQIRPPLLERCLIGVRAARALVRILIDLRATGRELRHLQRKALLASPQIIRMLRQGLLTLFQHLVPGIELAVTTLDR